MRNIFLLSNNDSFLLAIILGLFVAFGIPILLFILAATRKNKQTAKKLYIIAVVYLIISFGFCFGGLF